MLFVSIDLSGKGLSIKTGDSSTDPNNVFVSGFSDAILRFVAERGNENQLAYVEKIHIAKEVYSNTEAENVINQILLCGQ